MGRIRIGTGGSQNSLLAWVLDLRQCRRPKDRAARVPDQVVPIGVLGLLTISTSASPAVFPERDLARLPVVIVNNRLLAYITTAAHVPIETVAAEIGWQLNSKTQSSCSFSRSMGNLPTGSFAQAITFGNARVACRNDRYITAL